MDEACFQQFFDEADDAFFRAVWCNVKFTGQPVGRLDQCLPSGQ